MYLSKLICCNSGVNQLFTRMGLHEVPRGPRVPRGS